MVRNDRLPPVDRAGWLTMGEASQRLGVTPNTLRRWADRGQVPSFTTPGGHRRFLLAAILAFVPSQRPRRPALAAIGGSPDQMVRAYRRLRPARRAADASAWLAHLSDADRNRFRTHGMELVNSLLAYLDAEPHLAVPLLGKAEGLARDYGVEAAKSGASLSETVEGFLRFRKPFVDELAALARRRHLDTREATDLLGEAETALDRLLVAMMLGHNATIVHD